MHDANTRNRRTTLYAQHAQQQLSSAGGPHEGGKAVRGSNAAAAALGLVQVCFQIFFVQHGIVYMSLLSQLVLSRPQTRLYAVSSWCAD